MYQAARRSLGIILQHAGFLNGILSDRHQPNLLSRYGSRADDGSRGGLIEKETGLLQDWVHKEVRTLNSLCDLQKQSLEVASFAVDENLVNAVNGTLPGLHKITNLKHKSAT
jgi:hypothetical protein